MIIFFIFYTFFQNTQTQYFSNESCQNKLNYQIRRVEHNVMIYTKHLNNVNCVKIVGKINQQLTLHFLKQEKSQLSLKIKLKLENKIDQIKKQDVEIYQGQTQNQIAEIQPGTNKLILYKQGTYARATIQMPFNYYKLIIESPNQKKNEENPLKSFGLINYILFLLEILNNLIILDIALILMIFFQSDIKKLNIHRILTWFVLWVNIINFLYYVQTYQSYFFRNQIFLWYFIVSVLIITFNIYNNASGLLIQAFLMDKFVHADSQELKRWHRFFGILQYFLIKIQTFFKTMILYVVIGIKPTYALYYIICVNLLVWLIIIIIKVVILLKKKNFLYFQNVYILKNIDNLDHDMVTLKMIQFEIELKRKIEWCLLENILVVYKRNFYHPGGNFMLERVNKKHITPYYYGIQALESLPYRKLKFDHTFLDLKQQKIIKEYKQLNQSCKIIKTDKKSLYIDPGFAQWSKSYEYKVRSVALLHQNTVLFFIKPDDPKTKILTNSLTNYMTNYGKIFLLKFKHTKNFKKSYCQLSQLEPFYSIQKNNFGKIIELSNAQYKRDIHQTIKENILMDFSIELNQDFIDVLIYNKFLKRFTNISQLQKDDLQIPKEVEFLPMILILKQNSNLFQYVEKKINEQIMSNFKQRIFKQVKLQKKYKISIGGPFGFDNILKLRRHNIFFIDDQGLYSLYDFTYGLINNYLQTAQQFKEDQKMRAQTQFSFYYMTNHKNFTRQNYFLVALYLLQKILKNGFIQNIFVFNDKLQFEQRMKNYGGSLRNGVCIVSGSFNNSQYYYKILRDLVPKRSILFV